MLRILPETLGGWAGIFEGGSLSTETLITFWEHSLANASLSMSTLSR